MTAFTAPLPEAHGSRVAQSAPERLPLPILETVKELDHV